MKLRMISRSRRFPMLPLACRTQAGMALMECLVSILIFSFGVLGLMGLEASAINFSVDAEDRNRASVFANEVASTMWLSGTVTISGATLTALNTAVADPTKTGVPGGTLTITPVAGSTNSADIVITWKPPQRKVTDSTSTLTTRVILP